MQVSNFKNLTADSGFIFADHGLLSNSQVASAISVGPKKADEKSEQRNRRAMASVQLTPTKVRSRYGL